ncbi:MAG: hypothetical protein GF416_08465 [Candidatus Altiarchaeales archaeon]|nr:hypothetical protein [Candidatus Altiarchaeales archaeon]MBD3417148.1 hypothetical protein [Candidatus Altiarchaeales archaeon]
MEYVDFERKVFDISGERMPKGAWWWWFWLFFFDNPDDPSRPRQLMILWSTKNVKDIVCNDVNLKLSPGCDRSRMPGAVAAWYYDGSEMHHNYLLENCDILVSKGSVSSDSEVPAVFSVDGMRSEVVVGDHMRFISEASNDHEFMKPIYVADDVVGDIGYSILKLNRLELSGEVDGRATRGTSYFQRVFVNSPVPPWYWAVVHFENGAVLTYYNPHFHLTSIREDISYYDGERLHRFKSADISRSGDDLPSFTVSGENRDATIRLTVDAYSHSSWTFKKKTLGLVPNKLVYNEYPIVVSDFTFKDKSSGEVTTLEDLGSSVGNAEHTTGFLL